MRAKAFENPLLPNARLRAMYAAMTEVRALGKQISGCACGLEACWVAPAVELHAGDLTSVAPGGGGALVSYVRGRELSPGNALAAVVAGKIADHCLRQIGVGGERTWAALGAGLALRAAGQSGVVVAYVEASELPVREWKRLFSAASAADVPLLFVLLPDAGTVLETAQGCGVPAIPVDANDAIAMYRVTQESLVRARMGGGPALLGCISLPGEVTDPVELLAGQLVERRAGTATWISTNEAKFQARLEKVRARDRTRRISQLH